MTSFYNLKLHGYKVLNKNKMGYCCSWIIPSLRAHLKSQGDYVTMG